MVRRFGGSETISESIGPLVDDGAPYSGLGVEAFHRIQPLVFPDWNGRFDALPHSVASRPYWQYGTREHSSETRAIISSVTLTARSHDGNSIEIRHLVIAGSSQWVFGRRVTKYCNILHIRENALQLPSNYGKYLYATLTYIAICLSNLSCCHLT